MKTPHTRLVIGQMTDATGEPPRFWRKSDRGGGEWVEQIERATVYHGHGRAKVVAARQGGVVKLRDQVDTN